MTEPAEAPVLLERSEGWATITLNRPAVRNALDVDMAAALTDALVEAEADDDIQVVKLNGAGGAFCSGINLAATRGDDDAARATGAALRTVHETLVTMTTPVVVALERFAINAGMALVLAGDIVIAGESSFVQIGEIHLGTAAPMNVAWLRLKSTEQVAMRLALYGDRVPAPAAFGLGLVTEVVADDTVDQRASEVAALIASSPPGSAALMKRCITSTRTVDPDGWIPDGGGRSLSAVGRQERAS